MRYYNVEEVTFTNALGKSARIKEVLPRPAKASNSVNLRITQDDELDEIATRTNIYGSGYENKAYDIFAENMEELTQVDFDMNRLKYLRIPS